MQEKIRKLHIRIKQPEGNIAVFLVVLETSQHRSKPDLELLFYLQLAGVLMVSISQ